MSHKIEIKMHYTDRNILKVIKEQLLKLMMRKIN